MPWVMIVVVQAVEAMVARMIVVIVVMAAGFSLRWTHYLAVTSASHLARFRMRNTQQR